jgi:Leucine-rich repeat (LRR) protein
LYSLGLKELPSELFELTNLQILYLYNNQLKILPAAIGNLSNLQKLYLSGNELRSLPPEIGKLTKLCYLSISSNQLRHLPTEIGQLIQLIENPCRYDIGGGIFLDNNPLISPPPEIVNQGTAAILEYLNHQAEWHVRQMVSQAAGGIGAIAGIGLLLRYQHKRRMGKKKRA